MQKDAQKGFPVNFRCSRGFIRTHIPYLSLGILAFWICIKEYHPLEDFRPERFDDLNIETWYYTTNLHRGAFMLPKYVEDLLEEEENSL